MTISLKSVLDVRYLAVFEDYGFRSSKYPADILQVTDGIELRLYTKKELSTTDHRSIFVLDAERKPTPS